MAENKKSGFKKLLKSLGPGFITGASDDDPSGIGTYSQTGAQFGLSQLWTVFASVPFMIVVQEICGRIGLVTGKGLSRVIKENYPKSVLFFCISLLLIANTINIGADLGAMAATGQLLLGLPFIFWLIIITVFTLVLEIFLSYRVYAGILKYLTLSLLVYIVASFLLKLDWGKVALATITPTISLSKDYIINIVALLGTTISPYLFFWQTDEEVEEEIEKHKIRAMGKGIPKFTRKDIKNMRMDTAIGMIFSQIITFFIIVTTASTLGANGITNIQTADQAAQALRPFAGDLSYILFAAGVIGTGLLAVPVLAGSASYAISEAFEWKTGLSKKLKQAHGFYGVITIATLVGLLINFTGIQPFQLLYYTAVLNGFVAPILLFVIMLISNNKKIMGDNTNSFISNVLGWGITIIMGLSGLLLVYLLLKK